MSKKLWEATLEKANENLKEYGAQLEVRYDEDDDYSLLVHWSDGETESYATGYYEMELDELIDEAWPDVRLKSMRRGDRIIRCIVHVDTTGREGMSNGEFHHEHEYLGSEEAAVRWMNQTLHYVLDDAPTMVSTEEKPSVMDPFRSDQRERCAGRAVQHTDEHGCLRFYRGHHGGGDCEVQRGVLRAPLEPQGTGGRGRRAGRGFV